MEDRERIRGARLAVNRYQDAAAADQQLENTSVVRLETDPAHGAGDTQRAKIERFELAHRFDHIQIEGEHGFGKPEERAYLHAMAALGVSAGETWMIGDNLEWEVEAPQRLGIYAIWMDVHGDGLPAGSTARPDRIIRSLTELLPQGRIAKSGS